MFWSWYVRVSSLRASPGNEYPSYGQIPAGVPLHVTGKTNGWLSVYMLALPEAVYYYLEIKIP